MIKSYIETLVHLRLLVGFLGERAQLAWWPTAFFESSSRLFLEPVFSKTARLAQYHGVLEAARRLHDEHLNVGCYHLFRLPEEVEQDLHGLMQSQTGEDLAHQSSQSKESAFDALRRIAGSRVFDGDGPTAVGTSAEIDSTDLLKTIASAYLSAFSRNTHTYPYLVT